jgi:type IV pilus assembly protein PilB
MLIQAGLISEGQLERALAVQQMGGGRLGSILVRLKFLRPEDFRRALQQQLNVELVDLPEFAVDADAVGAVPAEFVRRYEMVPLRRLERGLLVGMVDPFNITAIDDLRFATNMQQIQVAAIGHQDYQSYLEKHPLPAQRPEENIDHAAMYDAALKSIGDDGDEDEEEGEEDAAIELAVRSTAPPVINMANMILVEACKRNASDVHIEPFEENTRIRFRIDGMLHTLFTPPRKLHNALISRIKVMADIDIANRRVPQDGRIAVIHEGVKIQMRVNTLPTTRGEKCVIRLAPAANKAIRLQDLALDSEQRRLLIRAARNPQGMILVTGPTASGKSTTVRAVLGELNDPQKNIITLEDPVEVEVGGINHVPIQSKGGVSFTAGLRAILRQDPDIIFVGEVRDAEVAAIATRAALTGHLVLSTLHTNSAVATLGRLVDLGVEPFLVGSTVLCIVGQRLVRRNCPRCVEPATPTEEQWREFRLSEEEVNNAKLLRGRGCPSCDGTGYKGRLPLYEVLPVTAELGVMIRDSASELDLLQFAQQRLGYVNLLHDGRRKALRGDTTLDEVQRVTITVE